ncbi:MAG TPA: PAS domain S-box protein [Microvirga sp.]|nr:PAS domain S-box protein [Microvirga sp.]
MADVQAQAQAQAFRDSLDGGGECGRLIASRDWSATALGPLDAWPPSLRTATSILLRSPVPLVMLWGEDGVMIYNDAYSAFAARRHPDLLGSPVREGWPEVAAFNDHVMKVGLAGGTLAYRDQELTLHRHGRPERVWMNLDYSPVLDESGRPAGVLAIVVETTARVAAERRNAFLLALGDALRPLADPLEVQATAARVLGEHLGAARVAYAEDAGDGETVVITCNYTDGVPDLVGTYRYADYGPDLLAEMRAGRALVRPDVRGDPSLTDAEKAAHAALGLGATLNVPLVKAGRLVAVLAVHHAGPHAFPPDEIALAREVAERTWAAVERARAETALRASEERLRQVQDAAGIGSFDFDRATGIAVASPQYLTLYGLDESWGNTFSYEKWISLVHPQDRTLIEAETRRAVSDPDRDHLDFDFRIVRADTGEVRWAAARTKLIRNRDGTFVRSVGAQWDITDRRAAEEALRESEARFRLMADAAPQIVWITDADGRVEFFNRQWADYVGLPDWPASAADVAAAAIHPDEAAMTLAAFDEARRTGGAFQVEHRIRSKTGAYRWFLVRAEPYRDPATGRIVRWHGASVDIDDRKVAEARLRALNETLEAEVAQRTAERDRIWQLSPDLMCVARTDGTLLSVNPAWERLLGWTADWLAGRNAGEIKHPEDAERTAAELARLAAGGHRTMNFEDRYRHRDGSWRWISWVIEPEGGLIYCIGRDVTAERAAREALAAAEAARREADALYRAYFENTPEALFVVEARADGAFVIEELNPAHEAGVGFRLAEVRGRRVEDILPPDVARRVLDTYRRVVETGEVYQYREVFDLGAAPQHWDTSLVPVRDASGRVARVIGSSRNVTRQVNAEESLRQAQKMEAVGQLTGGIAHDFNNLLGAVVGSLDLIRRKPGDIERVRRFAEAGLEAAERGAKLTGQLLAFSRAQRLELRPLVVSDLVEGMRDLLARTLGPMVRLGFALEGDGAVLSDPTQLEMAVLNLAINARDAMPEGGALTIGTRVCSTAGDGELAAGDYVELSVSDTGTGMPPEVAARAFDPFFTTKGVGKGTGLGLSQVYGIAKQAGGTVRIESRPGAGTIVRIVLPRTRAAVEARAASPADEAAPSEDGATILVVDDDRDIRRMLVASLVALGYGVLEAPDGPAGLAALEAGSPDLMMVDFAMPGMNGAEVAKAARERRPDLPIVFASGYADTAAIEAVAGNDALILRKPFRIDDLQAVLTTALMGRPPPGRP